LASSRPASLIGRSVNDKLSLTSPSTPTQPLPLAESRAAKLIREAFQSGRPLTYLLTSEEQRAGRILLETGDALGIPVWTWTLTQGLKHGDNLPQPGTISARATLDFIAAHPHPAIFHLKDFHEPLRESAEIRRALRDLYESCRDQKKFIVITSPVRAIPEELERSVIFLELRPPDQLEIIAFLREELRQTQATDEMLNDLAPALQGLTLDESRYAIRRALVETGSLSIASLPALLEEKRLLINRTGVVEFISEGGDITGIGGLEILKKWLLDRRKLFQIRDSLSQEIVPKGILLMGIPGCGKSLSVKAIAAAFRLPLYRVDMVEIFSGRHGRPENAFVQACRMMEDMSPAVLWFDEIEMGLNSSEAHGEQGRLFGFFLTWMQEKTPGLFVAATANRIDLLPAEILRKGRFDEVFFVDLPIDDERVEIFRIHLTRRGVDPAEFNLQQLKEITAGWSGAEVEQCVVSAITKARIQGQPLTARDLIDVAVKIVPLSRTMKEQINQIRGWAFERAVRASPKANR
jgi:SpoVK/Ycf46/Vps4 family AAA+-type ATPase